VPRVPLARRGTASRSRSDFVANCICHLRRTLSVSGAVETLGFDGAARCARLSRGSRAWEVTVRAAQNACSSARPGRHQLEKKERLRVAAQR
jgi:hypothetical protein